VATAFDDLAFDYDRSFTHTELGARLRAFVWQRCDVLFRDGQIVLELGCGTGEDAVRLARAGVRVVAIDPAERMLEAARAKVARADIAPIEFHRLAMQAAPQHFAGRRFDGVLSNFGAINCVDDIPALIRGLASLCAPEGRLLWVVMGRYVPWEWVWYGLRGQPRRAFRRLAADGIDWRGIRVRYPTPGTVSAWLRPFFRIDRIAPLGFFLPPSYAGGWLERSPRMLDCLCTLERCAQHSATFAACADHFMIEATRRTR